MSNQAETTEAPASHLIERLGLPDLIGATITAVDRDADSVTITTNRGIITAYQGDCGSGRSPEPYFNVRVLPLEHCRKWSGFGICGNPLPCKLHP